MRECEVRCGVPKAKCVPGAACQHLAPHYAPRTTHFAQREKRPQRAVSRILFPAFAWRRGKRRRSPNARLRRGDDHSSSPVIADGIQRPTRRLRTGRPMAPPYLVLLRAGFCLPPTLRPARCALTAPFHPYLRHADRMPGMSRRGLRRGPFRTLCTRCTWGELSRAHYGATTPHSTGMSRAVCFLCHFPSGCPDRGLPGALPCGVRTFLSPALAADTRRHPRGGRAAVVWLAAAELIVKELTLNGSSQLVVRSWPVTVKPRPRLPVCRQASHQLPSTQLPH